MAKPMIRAAIFDLGGVLVRTEDRGPRTRLAERFGLTYAELDEVVFGNSVAQGAEHGQATDKDAWIEAARQLHFPFEDIPEIEEQFFGGDRFDFELATLIQQIRQRCTTAALTNTWLIDPGEMLRTKYQAPEIFDFILSSAKEGVAKPDPAIFKRALYVVGAQPEETVFVDDNEHNIAAAQALGIHTVHFKSFKQARSELLALIPAGDL